MQRRPHGSDGRSEFDVRSSALMQILNGNSEATAAAWPRLAEPVTRLVYSFARLRGLQPADAQDLAQTVMLEVLRLLRSGGYSDRGGGSGSFVSWVRTIAHHRVIDLRRHRERRGEEAAGGSGASQRLAVVAGPADPSDTPEAGPAGLDPGNEQHRRYLRQELIAEVREKIEAEHPRMWAAFFEVVVKGRPAADVAADLGRQGEAGGAGLSTAAVYSYKSKILKLIRGQLRHRPDLFPELRGEVRDEP